MFTLKFEFILKFLLDKRWGKPKGQSKMDNPETLATLSRQEIGRRQTKKTPQNRNLKRSATRTPINNPGWAQVLAKGRQLLLFIIEFLKCNYKNGTCKTDSYEKGGWKPINRFSPPHFMPVMCQELDFPK